MTGIWYPREEQEIFTNRERELNLLELVRSEIEDGRRRHIALLGVRRIGKTIVMKEFLKRLLAKRKEHEVIAAYVDIERLALSPESFAQQFAVGVTYWVLRFIGEESAWPLDIDSSIVKLARLGKEEMIDPLVRLKGKLELVSALNEAFSFPQKIADALRKKVIICLDEFQEITKLSRFIRPKDILSLFRSHLQTQGSVAYVLAGSIVSTLEKVLQSSASPLFLHFQIEKPGYFTKEDTFSFVKKLMPRSKIPPETLREITLLTSGHPYFVFSLCMRLRQMVALEGWELSPARAKAAYVLELLTTEGRLYHYCRYLFEDSLNRARGKNLLRDVLRVLAGSPEGMMLSEVAKALGRESGVTRNLLLRLMEVDLVVQDGDGRYDIVNPLLKIWLSFYYEEGISLEVSPSKKTLEGLLKRFEEKMQRVSKQLGIAREAQVRELLQSFDGRELDGRLFGISGKVHLPKFRRVERHEDVAKSLEIDALGVNKEKWAVEVKWINKPAGVKEVKKAYEEAISQAARLWVISKLGFTENAVLFMRKNGILFSTEAELTEIFKAFKLRFKARGLRLPHPLVKRTDSVSCVGDDTEGIEPPLSACEAALRPWAVR